MAESALSQSVEFLERNYEGCDRSVADVYLTLPEVADQVRGVYPSVDLESVAQALRACGIKYRIIDGETTYVMRSKP